MRAEAEGKKDEKTKEGTDIGKGGWGMRGRQGCQLLNLTERKKTCQAKFKPLKRIE